MSVFDVLAQPVAFALKAIHSALSQVLPAGSGWAWGLSIVLLTITVRILLFPLFVKQIKSQRRMQELAPKVKELQAKHKGDRETLNTELMKLYKDHGTNPISGCLPLILQLPIFFALFRVMNEFRPKSDGTFAGKYGLPSSLIDQGAHAKIFGAPISAAFNSSAKLLQQLGGDATTVKIVAVIMIVTMGATTFFTQKQMMARNGAAADPQQAQVQKIMLYVLPFSFAIFGFSFPIGVLLYWLTTNVWSMGQQRYVIARMPPVVPGGAPTPKGAVGTKELKAGRLRKGAAKDDDAQAAPEATTVPNGKADVQGAVVATADTSARPPAGRPVARGAAGSRKNKSRKGGRR
ncbi:MAG: 60 kDa inner rane insertion protein [Frankiales bacterium]|nr:60 kDa inner rane insertion protein [Frankiales bacterium]